MASKEGKRLVIVESPTKAKTIGRFLGSPYEVTSTYGHVLDLPQSKLAVDIEHDFAPQYMIPVKARKAVAALKKLAKGADILILATDSDREGEAIAWHVKEILAAPDSKTRRIVFHEITKPAIEAALEHPRALDNHLVDAQKARRVLDRLVGYKLSPLLWKKVAKGLSAGRVQSVAVRLVVEREKEREEFKPVKYWSLGADVFPQARTNDIFKTELVEVDDKPVPKPGIRDESEVETLLNDLKTASLSVAATEEKPSRRHPLPPYTTSTLQQDASRRLYMAPRQTMFFAQRLYEEGLITYMRTDSTYMADPGLEAAGRVIREDFGERYASATPRRFKTKSRLAQEAHEAIRPTDFSQRPEALKEKLESRPFRLYDLIWRRAIASQMPAAEINTRVITVAAKGARTMTLEARGQTLVFDGFIKVYPMKITETELPVVSQGETLGLKEARAEAHETEPPPRYSEATLIKALEERGIGRPSTYAPTISTLFDRGYVERDEAKKLAPTEVGRVVNGLLTEHFPKVVDYDFTANMEAQLDDVAEGKTDWVPVIRAFYEPFAKNLEEKYDVIDKGKINHKAHEVCPKCGLELIYRFSRFGKFLACTGFPKCRFTKSIDDGKPKVACPDCKEGQVIPRRAKKTGKRFYGCSRYPACKFVSKFMPKPAPTAVPADNIPAE